MPVTRQIQVRREWCPMAIPRQRIRMATASE